MAPANDANPQNGQGRPLPKKENDLFKGVVKNYEVKQYKKAMKQADTILKKFPNHGETLAMKGLVLNCMAKRDEAHALVKQGLMNDMRSHVCWHVYGLLYRSDRNYNEAIKAYKQALRIDADNIQILRDLSMLQVQMRDLGGFAITRHTILSLKPNGKINWLAFALAKHLDGDLREAISVIDIYLGTLEEGSPELQRGFESSELALYKNKIMAEIPNNLKEALANLDECKDKVVDLTAWNLAKCKYQLHLGLFDEAKDTALQMLDQGLTENYKVHNMYMCALLKLDIDTCEESVRLAGTRTIPTMLPLSDEQRLILLDAYKKDVYPKFEKSAAVNRIPMNLVDGDNFRSSMDVFCRKNIVKGVPSLCNELSTFFLIEKKGRYQIASDPVDVRSHAHFKLIVELVDGYMATLESKSRLLPEDEHEEPKETSLWVWYLRAGLHELAGEYTEGIALLDKCLEHTPSAVDAYELKARLLKSAGNIKAAVEALDKGRDLDKQDRYINNQTTKYMLQAGMETDALQRISMFTKHEGNPEANLYDMQCSWYELELAACYARKENWGRALRKYAAVVKHFDDFHEDQFDFHAYCVRKVTLRAYTEVLRFEDTVWSEDYYFRAAEGIIQIYLHLDSHPDILAQDKEPDYSQMSAGARKKAKAIARKKRIQAEKKEADRKAKEEEAAKNGDGQKKSGKKSPIDEDPDGAELLKKDILEEANKYSSILSKYCPTRVKTWALQYDVSMRRNKPLLALQALFKLQKMDSDCSELFARIVHFSTVLPTLKDADERVFTVINECFEEILGGKSISDFVTEAASAIEKTPASGLTMRIAAAEALVTTGTKSPKEAAKLITNMTMDTKEVSPDNCKLALKALDKFGAEAASDKSSYIETVKGRFPQSIGLE